MEVVWTEYLKYRALLRGFDPSEIENIVLHSTERYYDVVTGRRIAIGRYDRKLILIPYEAQEDTITPVTMHVTTRQQVNVQINSGRYIHG